MDEQGHEQKQEAREQAVGRQGELREEQVAPGGSQATQDHARLGRRRDVRQRRHIGHWNKFYQLPELALDTTVFSHLRRTTPDSQARHCCLFPRKNPF